MFLVLIILYFMLNIRFKLYILNEITINITQKLLILFTFTKAKRTSNSSSPVTVNLCWSQGLEFFDTLCNCLFLLKMNNRAN